MSTPDDAQLASSLNSLGAALGSVEPVLVEYLGQVVQAATDVLGVDGVGLMLLDDRDTLRVVGVTDAMSQALEEAQAALGFGPGLDSMRRDATIAIPDLSDATEYAALWQLVAPAGVRALLSSPVRVDGAVIGNFNAWAGRPAQWSAQQVRANEAYAGLVGTSLRLTAQGQSPELPVARGQFEPG